MPEQQLMKRSISLILVLLLAALFAGCGSTPARSAPAGEGSASPPAAVPSPAPELPPRQPETVKTEEGIEEMGLHLAINDVEVSVEWEDNEAVKALPELVSSGPLTVHMSMYGGFEQVGSLGVSLPRSDSQTTTQAGDIVLYSGSQMVIFYGSNSWAYTRLGKITDKSAEELTELLGNGDVTVTLTLK